MSVPVHCTDIMCEIKSGDLILRKQNLQHKKENLVSVWLRLFIDSNEMYYTVNAP